MAWGGGLASYEMLASDHPIRLDPDRLHGTLVDATIHEFLSHEVTEPGGTLLTDDYNPIDKYRAAVGEAWRKSESGFLGSDWARAQDF
jgi:hypothetical protein